MQGSKKFIYYPILFLLALFCIDKIFLLEYFKKGIVQTGNQVYYLHREKLLEKLSSKYSEIKSTGKKLVLVFGDSRAYPYSNMFLSKERKDKYEIYNFASPQAAPVYSLYIGEKIYNLKINPNLNILIVSPEGFDDTKRLISRPFLRLAASKEFVDKYWDKIPFDDKYEYFLDSVFAYRKFDFDFKLLIERLNSGTIQEYNYNRNLKVITLNLFNGEDVGFAAFQNDPTRLKKDSERMGAIYLNNFKFHDTEFFFLEEFLKNKSGEKIYLVWPRVFPEYFQVYKKLGIDREFEKRIKQLSEKYKVKFFNLNEGEGCDVYYDASHQSASCYDFNLNLLLNNYESN